MTFSDDDLKRLKEDIENPGPMGEICLMDYRWKELLARLEAAEAYGEFRLRFSAGHDGENERLEAWRKSEGK